MMNVLMAPRKLPSYFAVEEAVEPSAPSAAAPPRPAATDARTAMIASRGIAARPHDGGALPCRDA